MARVKSITRKKYVGKVHDLTVENLHAYNINGLSVHNSAVGSLTLYVLGVIQLDPIKYGLLFERFLNPDRISPPDVDVDFEYTRRPEVIDYVVGKYGENNCSKIGTYQKKKSRSIIRDVVKAMDLGRDWEAMEREKKENPYKKPTDPGKSLELANVIAKLVPEDENGVSPTIDECYSDSPEFRSYVDNYRGLLDNLKHMEKVLGSAGVHPSGYVVCKHAISDHVPMKLSKDDGVCCQFDGPEVEELGLLKFDFLGLKNLTIVDKSLMMIKERHGVDIDIEHLEPDDKKVFALFNGGNDKIDNRGIFQFESYGMSRLLKDIRVDSFNDLCAANALFRPGPLGAGVHELYADYKLGRKPIKPLHPKMGEVLKNTYGLMVFQEDFMKVAQELALFTKGESDVLRKIVGKKKPELIKKEKIDTKFVEGCVRNGINERIASEIFKQIEYFGGYGFNKSHSAVYAFQAYQNMYLKLYYPIEFMCNLLTINLGNEDKIDAYINQAKKMGIVIKRADLHKSGIEFTIDKEFSKIQNKEIDVIRVPFTALKGVGKKAVISVIENRPFKNLEDLLNKVNLTVFNCKVFNALVDAGAMFCLVDPSKYRHCRNAEEAGESAKIDLIKEYEVLVERISKERTREKNKDKKAEKLQNELEDTFGGSLFDMASDSEIKF